MHHTFRQDNLLRFTKLSHSSIQSWRIGDNINFAVTVRLGANDVLHLFSIHSVYVHRVIFEGNRSVIRNTTWLRAQTQTHSRFGLQCTITLALPLLHFHSRSSNRMLVRLHSHFLCSFRRLNSSRFEHRVGVLNANCGMHNGCEDAYSTQCTGATQLAWAWAWMTFNNVPECTEFSMEMWIELICPMGQFEHVLHSEKLPEQERERKRKKCCPTDKGLDRLMIEFPCKFGTTLPFGLCDYIRANLLFSPFEFIRSSCSIDAMQNSLLTRSNEFQWHFDWATLPTVSTYQLAFHRMWLHPLTVHSKCNISINLIMFHVPGKSHIRDKRQEFSWLRDIRHLEIGMKPIWSRRSIGLPSHFPKFESNSFQHNLNGFCLRIWICRWVLNASGEKMKRWKCHAFELFFISLHDLHENHFEFPTISYLCVALARQSQQPRVVVVVVLQVCSVDFCFAVEHAFHFVEMCLALLALFTSTNFMLRSIYPLYGIERTNKL